MVRRGGGVVKASDLFVRCLEAQGVRRIFGVPGEENAAFMMSLEKSLPCSCPGCALTTDRAGGLRYG